jgi:hypothetical protein
MRNVKIQRLYVYGLFIGQDRNEDGVGFVRYIWIDRIAKR